MKASRRDAFVATNLRQPTRNEELALMEEE